jgi:hypothetical protein
MEAARLHAGVRTEAQARLDGPPPTAAAHGARSEAVAQAELPLAVPSTQ